MKRFKNVLVGTTAEFATLSVNGNADLTLKAGVTLVLGMVFVNDTTGAIYMLGTDGGTKMWKEIDNATGYAG